MLHDSLTDILGKNAGLPYDQWLVGSSQKYITEKLERDIEKWIDVIGLADPYTGRINTTRTDILEFVSELQHCYEIILALAALAKSQMEERSKDVSER